MKFLKYYEASISNEKLELLSKKFRLPKKVLKLIVSRGFKTEKEISDYLNPSYDMLYDPFKLKNMTEAIQRINLAIQNNEKILVFGDYDVDGVSATAIMLKTFGKLGVKVNFYLPNRYVDGYGLTNDVLDKIKAKYNPKLIITVDCGISSHAEVEYAKTLGIETIVTDHHEIPETLPNCIVINAKMKGQEYPFSELCGAGLAYKVSSALLGEKSKEFLPIAAIATIADIVPLKDENRAIVKLGMTLMERYLPIGIKTMFKEQKMTCANSNSMDIAFRIAPKLNASGRMGDAKDSLDLYMENNPQKAKKILQNIFVHNTDRQALCNTVYADCKKQLKNYNMSNQKSIILASKNWDQGILGIVCSRLLDEYNRPVFLFSEVDGLLKGSARSLNELNVHALLTNMQDILETFGGHTMAAGLTLQLDKFDVFKKRVNSYINQNINDKVFSPISYYDEEITMNEVTPSFVQSLKVLEPLGCNNQVPRFKVKSDNLLIKPMKNFKNHANLILDKKLNLVAFNYTKNYYKTKYAKDKSFIFEFQENKGRYKSPYVKGLLKEFDSNFTVSDSKVLNAESFYLSQLKHNEKAKAKYQEFEKEDMLQFVTDCALSVFGTCFVFTSKQSLDDFAKTYTSENIYNFEIGENLSLSGFNTIIFAPENIEFAKHYKKIIFVDAVLDKKYIAAINKITKAKIYVAKNTQLEKKVFEKIYTQRDNFGKVYKVFKVLNGREFVNLEDMYSEFYKNKINFNDFYAALLVFEELNLIKLERQDLITIRIIDGKKVPLTKSSVYNFINFMKRKK